MHPDPLAPGILYEDPYLIAIDKPAGLLSLPDGYDPDLPYVTRLLEPIYGRLWIVHRLDRETSGVLVLARSPEAHKELNVQFSSRAVEKTYHAIAEGYPAWSEIVVEVPLRTNAGHRHRHRTVPDRVRGKPAVTELRVIERFRGYCLIEAHPHTGYTHQIRAHLAFAGNPVAGDVLYGATPYLIPPNKPAITRTALHAYRLMLRHPVTGEMLHVEAPYPKDFESALAALRKGSRAV